MCCLNPSNLPFSCAWASVMDGLEVVSLVFGFKKIFSIDFHLTAFFLFEIKTNRKNEQMEKPRKPDAWVEVFCFDFNWISVFKPYCFFACLFVCCFFYALFWLFVVVIIFCVILFFFCQKFLRKIVSAIVVTLVDILNTARHKLCSASTNAHHTYDNFNDRSPAADHPHTLAYGKARIKRRL